MVRDQIEARGIRNPAVLSAMRAIPRHLFVPDADRDRAYSDRPLPIGNRQTISQPYIVALMTELLDPKASDRVLEIGTGSGYQAAVLSRCVKEVYSIELEPELARDAASLLRKLGFGNVVSKQGDGYAGWPDRAPFDKVIVTAAPPSRSVRSRTSRATAPSRVGSNFTVTACSGRTVVAMPASVPRSR